MKKFKVSSVLLMVLMHGTVLGMQITKACTVKPKIQRQFQVTPSARGGIYMHELIHELKNSESPLHKLVQGYLDLKTKELELKKIEVECQIRSAYSPIGILGRDCNSLLQQLNNIDVRRKTIAGE